MFHSHPHGIPADSHSRPTCLSMATRHSTAVPFTAKTGRVLCGPMNDPVTMIWRLMDGSQLFGQQKVPIVEENAVVSEKSFESATLEMIIYPPKIIHLLGPKRPKPLSLGRVLPLTRSRIKPEIS